jgi:RNA polymerase sigma-70 factor, ECF subfamily
MDKFEVTNSLIISVNKGDTNSFRVLYELYHAPLFTFARKFVDFQDAEDIVADVFLKLWAKREDLYPMRDFKNYLIKWVQNSCLKKLEADSRLEEYNRTAAIIFDEMGAKEFELELLRVEVYERIREEVDKLPNQTKRVMELAFLKGLKNAEIAQRLGTSEQTVRNQKTNALAKLRIAFGKNSFFILILLSIE